MENNSKIISSDSERCPVRASLSLLGGKWTFLILYQINKDVMRYGEIRRAVTGISEKMLIQELNKLVKNNLIHKKVYSQIPPKVEYQLTELGLKALPIADKLAEFGSDNL